MDESITLIARDPEADPDNPIVKDTGISGGITWTVYDNGLLTLEGTGDYELLESTDEDMSGTITAWAKYGYEITSVKMNVTGITFLDYLLDRCWAVQQMDFSNSDFSNVTSAENMFSGELYNRDTTLFLIKCPTGVNIDIPLPKGKGFGWYNDADRSAPFYTSFPKDLTESMTLRKATVQEFPDDENMFAEGKSGNVSWNIDLNGKLTITGTGNYELTDIDVYDSSLNETYVEKDVPEWMKYASYIESATVGISGITTTKNMFKNCTNLKSINLSGLDTSKVTDMSGMFDSCNSLVKADVSGFDTSHVTTAGTMFGNCNSLKKLDLSGCDFSGLEFENSYDMEETDTFGLWSCTSLEEIRCPLNLEITSEYAPDQQYELPKIEGRVWVDSSKKMYTSLPENLKNSITLTAIDGATYQIVSGTSNQIHWKLMGNGKLTITGTGDYAGLAPWREYADFITMADVDVTGMTNASAMFANCRYLKEVDLSGFDTSNVTDMSSMFNNCYALKELDLSMFNTSNVTDMNSMFYSCSGLKELNLSNFNTEKVTSMSLMFYYCSSLQTLDISGFTFGDITSTSSMWDATFSLQKIVCPAGVTRDIAPPNSAGNVGWMKEDKTGEVYTALPENLETLMTIVPVYQYETE